MGNATRMGCMERNGRHESIGRRGGTGAGSLRIIARHLRSYWKALCASAEHPNRFVPYY